MCERYVVAAPGFDYNDEFYYQTSGFGGLSGKAYSSLDEAHAEGKRILRRTLSDIDISGFEGFITDDIRSFLAEDDSDEYYSGKTWEEFIVWAEQNNINWIRSMPVQYHLLKVELED